MSRPVEIHDAETALAAELLATRAEDEERELLASFLVDADLAREMAPRLKAADLFGERHRTVLTAIQRIVERREHLDPFALRDELSKRPEDLETAGGFGFLMDLAGSIPTTAHAPHYFQKVVKTSARRRLARAAHRIKALAFDLDVADPVSEALGCLLAIETVQASTVRHISEVMASQVSAIEAAYEAVKAGERPPVAKSGFYDLDQALVMTPGKLIVIAARPAFGKTSLAFQIAENVAKTDPVLVVTLEMQGEELAGRIIAAEANISANAQAHGAVRDDAWTDLYAAAERYAGLQLYIDDAPSATIAQVEASARRLQAKLGRNLGLVEIDYLGLLEGDGRDETSKISKLSRESKKLAKALGCPVVLLSQLSRAVESESRKDKRPLLSDLRQSGSVEQDADAVMFIYRDEYYNPETTQRGVAELLLRKNRGGPITTVLLHFDAAKTRFSDVEYTPTMQPANDAFEQDAFTSTRTSWDEDGI